MLFPALLVALLPYGLVVLYLIFEHGVENHRDLMGRRSMRGLRPNLAFMRRK